MTFQEKYFSWTDQIWLSDCLYFLRYWLICVLQLFVSLIVTSWILKPTLSFSWRCLNIWISLEQKELLRRSKKHFFIMFTELSVAKNCLRHESVPLILQINLRSKILAFLKRFHEISNFAREKALSWRNAMTYLFLFNFEFKLEL